MAFKPIDPKRDEFRRYLERAGVIEALTKVFVRVIKERPEDPMEYLRNNLGDTLQEADSYVFLRNELDEARAEIQRLRSMIEKVNPEALAELDDEKQSPPQVIENIASENADSYVIVSNATDKNPAQDTDNNKDPVAQSSEVESIEKSEPNETPSKEVSQTINNAE